MDPYEQFLRSKVLSAPALGVRPMPTNEALFPFQADIVRWALRRGRAAIFADCGLGKTLMQLEWANQIANKGNVLILTPLAVAEQTVSEGAKFGIEAHYCRAHDQLQGGITVTNYEMLDHFDAEAFAGIVIDESSILKHYDSKTRNQIISRFRDTPYRLACTATPAPNDYMELGNHSEFLGVMTRAEMLSMFFVHDGARTSQWRIKGHAQQKFWAWVASWSVMLRKPSDLGYDDVGFILPPLAIESTVVSSEPLPGYLIPMEAAGLQERIAARRESTAERVAACAERIAKAAGEEWLVWCNLNAEADALEKQIPGAVQIAGSESVDAKVAKLCGFVTGAIRVLISKPSICGHGMNFQHCRNVAFVGLSDSWEEYYQAVRRCWRFGQQREVNVVIVTSEAEGSVLANIQRKELEADRMASEMIKHMHTINESNLKGAEPTRDSYNFEHQIGEGWALYLGDCVDVVGQLEPNSIDYSIFSPPFSSLYTYSASERDIGNCRSDEEFFLHMAFLSKELFRVLKPGRSVSFHCMNLPTSKTRDGVIGVRDFRGNLIRYFEAHGFIFHSEVCIWKDPVTAMQRTKALGLLWKQLKKDSVMSRQGIPDYLVTMRKPGENAEPIAHTAAEFPVERWQQWASPVWTDIDPGDTLQFRSAREHDDERHICPLQLEVIRRGLILWSNKGDLVLSPFAGIGSEGFEALKLGRKFVGVELKESYYRQAVANLRAARQEMDDDLFTARKEVAAGEIPLDGDGFNGNPHVKMEDM